MSYEVTATRRRPQRFEDLVGQEFVAETLKNSIQSDKIAHAYLFTGPRGCGKTSTARILAKALNCQSGPSATPCGKCQQCIEITKGSCTDVIEIDGASNTSVNDVRQIKDEVLFPPQSSRYKIYIIDEVHMLTISAFNALLKTIEEPPPYVIFIFATTELQKVPATIKSRCQQFNFRLVPVEQVKNSLAQACDEIGIKAEDEALYWVARESTGSMRDAYTLFDQVAAFSGDLLTYDKIRDKLGLVGVDRLNTLFDDCVNSRPKEALEKIDDYLQSGISIEQLISNCTDYMRSLLLIRNGITKEALLGQAPERYSQDVLKGWSSVQIERGLSMLLQLYRDIRYSLSPRYELELCFTRLSWLSQYVSPAEVKAAIDKAQSLLSGAPASPVQSNALQTEQRQSFNMSFAPHSQTQVQSIKNEAPQKPQVNKAYTDKRPQMPVFSALKTMSEGSPAQDQMTKPDVQQEEPKLPPQKSEQHAQTQQSAPVQGYTPDSEYPPVELGAPESDEGSQGPFSIGGAEPPEQPAVSEDSSDLRSKVIKAISAREAILASSLMQTSPWSRQGNTILAFIESRFQFTQLQKESAKISQIISSVAGEQLVFKLSMQQIQTKADQFASAPSEVKILCNMFKGQIIGHSKKEEGQSATDTNNESQENKPQAGSDDETEDTSFSPDNEEEQD